MWPRPPVHPPSLWIGCDPVADPGLECDVWTQFSNSIGHTLPAQLLACLSASAGNIQLPPQTHWRQQIPVIFCTSVSRREQPIQLLQMAFSPLFFFGNWTPGSDSFGDPAAQYRENRPADMKDASEPNSKSETLASLECKNGIFDIFKNHSILKLSSMTIPRVEASWRKVSYKSVVGRFNLVFNPWNLLAGCSCCLGSTSSSLYRKLIKVTSDWEGIINEKYMKEI